jgi:hypothetical protein
MAFENIFSDGIRRDKMSRCYGRKDHEGKTFRLAWPSIRTRRRTASIFPYLRYKENPGGRAGTFENKLEFMLW